MGSLSEAPQVLLPSLPTELWRKILSFAADVDSDDDDHSEKAAIQLWRQNRFYFICTRSDEWFQTLKMRSNLVLVCRFWQQICSEYLYRTIIAQQHHVPAQIGNETLVKRTRQLHWVPDITYDENPLMDFLMTLTSIRSIRFTTFISSPEIQLPFAEQLQALTIDSFVTAHQFVAFCENLGFFEALRYLSISHPPVDEDDIDESWMEDEPQEEACPQIYLQHLNTLILDLHFFPPPFYVYLEKWTFPQLKVLYTDIRIPATVLIRFVKTVELMELRGIAGNDRNFIFGQEVLHWSSLKEIRLISPWYWLYRGRYPALERICLTDFRAMEVVRWSVLTTSIQHYFATVMNARLPKLKEVWLDISEDDVNYHYGNRSTGGIGPLLEGLADLLFRRHGANIALRNGAKIEPLRG